VSAALEQLLRAARSPWSTAGLAFACAATLYVARRRSRARRGWYALAIATCLALAATATALALTGRDWSYFFGLVRFTQPRMLAVTLVAALVVASRAARVPRGLSRTRARVMWTSLALATTFATLAVAGPEWGHPIDRLTVMVGVDRSRSMDLVPDAHTRIRDDEARAITRMHDEDRVGRVIFGAEAATEDPARPRNALTSTQDVRVGADGTDIAAAIRRSLAEIPDESAGRIVLVTDGASNRGDPLAAAAAASAAGVPVDVVRMAQRERPNVRIEGVRVPGDVDEDEAFDLRVVTRSTREVRGQVRVRVDGRVVQTGPVTVRAGEDVLTLRQTAPAAGLHRYEVDVTASDPTADAIVQDNTGGVFLRVRGPSSVLVLEGDAGRAAPFANALRAAAFRVEERDATGFPDDLASLAAYDLVVLSDVPARALAPEQMEQLAQYVRDLGGGLLLMGGDRSMGPGGYSRTPIEEISPVSFDLRQERRRASLTEVIAIDFSGSMSVAVASGQTKLQLANEAAARSATLLGPGDRLGVMHVDTQVHWTIPIETIGNQSNTDSIVQRIRAVGPSGGGIIIPVTLTASYEALGRETTNLRHLLLFADGNDAEQIQGQASVVAQAFARGITTSVVSLGRGSDTAELEHLSREGHGRFYLVEDATRLPAVFAQETILAARSSIREEPFRPAVASPDVVTRGIDFAAGPPLHGYVVTIAKPRASVLLTGLDNDPILATWQVGVGRVGAFTSDAKDRWGAEWLQWPEAQRMWGELARSLVRRPDPLVRVDADTAGGALHVHTEARTVDGYADSLRRLTARVTGPDGVTRELALDPTGAGTYAAEQFIQRPGAYAIGIRDDEHGAIVATGGALLLEGEELRPPTDPQLLERIVSMTGGRLRPDLANVFDDRVGLRRAYTTLVPSLLYAAALLMFLALVARRVALPDWLSGERRARKTLAPAPASAAETTVAALLARRAPRTRDHADAPGTGPPGAEPIPIPVAAPPTPASETTSDATATGATRATEPASTTVAAASTGSSSLDALLAKRQRAAPSMPSPVAPPPRAAPPAAASNQSAAGKTASTNTPPEGPAADAPAPAASHLDALLAKKRSKRGG